MRLEGGSRGIIAGIRYLFIIEVLYCTQGGGLWCVCMLCTEVL